jgi:tRNA (mo5U34)-methyltransferase
MLDVEAVRQRIAQCPHWYHRIEVAPGVVTPGVNDSAAALRLLELPADCRGLRALDIGASDGFFSFELERRGATVLAIDHRPIDGHGFKIARDLLGSKVQYEVANVYDLNPERFGKFDIVLFLGVLYHLRNPILALDRIESVCKDRLWVESHVMDGGFVDPKTHALGTLKSVAPKLVSVPIMQFFPRAELNGDFTNWWAPNMACLQAMLESCNFVVESSVPNGARGIFRCRVGKDAEMNWYRQMEKALVP